LKYAFPFRVGIGNLLFLQLQELIREVHHILF